MTRNLSAIATDITAFWPRPSPYAIPYIKAMRAINHMTDMHYADSASSVVAYFLANASAWRGPEAKRIKAELNAMLKAHRS